MTEKMKQFIQIVQEDEQRAKALFFSEAFKNDYLEEGSREKEIYHQLLLGRNRGQILEEFLICAGGKEPAVLRPEKEVYEIRRLNAVEPMNVRIRKEGQGYVHGRIHLDSTFLSIEKTEFTEEDFQDGILTVPVTFLDAQEESRGILSVYTPYSSCQADILFDAEGDTEEELAGLSEKIFEAYMNFCLGKCRVMEFVENEKRLIGQMEGRASCEIQRTLLSLHCHIIQGAEEAIERGFVRLEPNMSEIHSDPFYFGYFLYLKALYLKTPDQITHARDQIHGLYPDAGEKKGYLLWMLIYLDEDLTYDSGLQLQKMRELYETGQCNSFLWFEAATIWNQDHSRIKSIGAFEQEVIHFGICNDLFSKSMLKHIYSLVLKEKGFSEFLLADLILSFQKEESQEGLQAVCSMLIRGNCMDECCHIYYKKAVQAGIQMIGLQESYLRTIAKDRYPYLEKNVLLYFSYSNSLSSRERAYLYANLVKNRRKYESVFPSFEPQIEEFLLEQLVQGKINTNLFILYQAFFDRLLEGMKGRAGIANIMAKQKLICKNPAMERAVIYQKELKEVQNVSLESGEVYVTVYSEPLVVFLDQEDNRYLSLEYTFSRLWNGEQEEAVFSGLGRRNEAYLIRQSLVFKDKAEFSAGDIQDVEAVLECQSLKEEYRHRIFEKLLEYYWKHGRQEELEQALSMVQWKYLSSENCKQMLEYFIAGRHYKEAMKGMEIFGFGFMDPEPLKEVVLHELTSLSRKRVQNLLDMSLAVFQGKVYNSEILAYLERFYRGDLKQMLEIWDQGEKHKIYDQEFTEEILKESAEQGAGWEVVPVFLAYAGQDVKDRKLVKRLTDQFVFLSYEGKRQLSEEFYPLLGRLLDQGNQKLIWQWAYLDYYKDKDLTTEQKTRITKIIESQEDRHSILPVLLQFKEEIPLPYECFTYTYVVYRGEKDSSMVFHYAENKSEPAREIPMRELLPGYYAAQVLIFADETADYYVTAPGEERRRRKDIVFLDHSGENQKGRFYQLNHMLREKQRESVAMEMEIYAYEKAMTDLIRPMTEDQG